VVKKGVVGMVTKEELLSVICEMEQVFPQPTRMSLVADSLSIVATKVQCLNHNSAPQILAKFKGNQSEIGDMAFFSAVIAINLRTSLQAFGEENIKSPSNPPFAMSNLE
jgi:hypothetical protein